MLNEIQEKINEILIFIRLLIEILNKNTWRIFVRFEMEDKENFHFVIDLHASPYSTISSNK